MLLSALEQFSFTSAYPLVVSTVLALYVFSLAFSLHFTGVRGVLNYGLILFIRFFYYRLFNAFIPSKYNRYCFILIFFFLLIWNLNIFGTCSYALNFTGILYTTTLIVFCLLTWIFLLGLSRSGINIFGGIVPLGLPGFLAKSIIFIECISYISRFASLNVRLFINIVSGHLILKLLYNATLVILFNCQLSSYHVLSLLVFLGLSSLVFLLEIFVAFLQTYIFFFLVCIYLQNSLS